MDLSQSYHKTVILIIFSIFMEHGILLLLKKTDRKKNVFVILHDHPFANAIDDTNIMLLL